MQSDVTRMGENGRVVIPAPIREAVGLKPGDRLEVTVEEYGLRIQTSRQKIAEAQAVARRLFGPGRSPSRELIAERRLAAKREEEEIG
jgi:AbrB family looped-hinge helix DNA binding protein